MKIIHYFRTMNDNNGDIKELLRQVENKLGRSLATPSDFDALLLSVFQTTGERMSISTIKRLVGYVSDSHEPSNATLSVLARYLGYRDWIDFTLRNEDPTSGSLSQEIIQSDHLQIDDQVEMEWLPNRYCRMRYLGNKRFEVVEVRGSNRLAVGDTLDVMLFGLGQPMMTTNHEHNGTVKPFYIAGRTHGLVRLAIVKR